MKNLLLDVILYSYSKKQKKTLDDARSKKK